MRSLALVLGLVFATTASAQSVGDVVTVNEDVRSLRFPDADVTGPTFDEGQSATVLYVMDGRVRLRRGNDYGWVDGSVVALPEPVAIELDDE
mgnify:CR=1 FL=1